MSKRSHLAVGQADSGDESEDQVDESGDAGVPQKRQRRQKSSKRPKHETSNISVDINLSQHRDFSISQAHKEADVGIVELISLRNFMCHGCLDVPLGPHVNFIIGRNGSGKSAIVTALVVGLGGKASVTSRGNTVKSFIKNGKQQGEVEIHLRNRGPDAFKPDQYGESIVVHRKFFADGGGKYFLKSKQGKIISDKREELGHILDHFNIQVDNPVAILNQDTSRNFLNSKNSHDKYKFFLKATLLEQMQQDYASAHQHIEETQAIMEQKLKALPSHEKEVLEWEHKFKSLDALEKLKEEVENLKKEMTWAFIWEKEKELEPIGKQLQKEEARMPIFIQKVEESKAKVHMLTARFTEVQDKILAVNEEIKQIAPELDIQKKVLTQEKEILRKLQNKARSAEKDLKTAQRDRDQCLERIADLRNSAQHDYEAARQKRRADIEALTESLSVQEAKHSTVVHDKEQFLACLGRCRNEVYAIRNEEQQVSRQRDEINKQMQNLQAARGDRLKRFGAWTPAVLKKIADYNKRGSFKRIPVGPIGANFELRDQKWALALEVCLKSLIHSFCVDNHNDEKVLEEIFTSEIPDSRRPPIIVRKFKDTMHDVSRFRVQGSKYPTVLDMLKIDDPNVANVLIDQRAIENILFIADSEEARNVMYHSPPENCRETFTLTGDQILISPTFRYYSSNQERAKFMTANVEEQIVHCRTESQRLEARLVSIQQKQNELQQEMRKNQQEERRMETQLMKISESITKIKCDIDELKSIEDPVPVNVTTLEEEVQNLNEQITALEQLMRTSKEELAQQAEKYAACETKYKDIGKGRQQKLDSAEPLKEEQDKISTEIHLAKGHLKHYEEKKKEFEKCLQDLENAKAKHQQELKRDIEKAEKIHPVRIKTRRTPHNIEEEINQIKKRISVEEKSRGDPAEITRIYNEKKTIYLQILKDVKQCQLFIEKLEETLGLREVRYEKLKRYVSYRIKSRFLVIMASSQFLNGKMNINHNKRALDLVKLNKIMKAREKQYQNFRQSVGLRARYLFIVYLNNRNYSGKMTFNHHKETLEMNVKPASSEAESAKDLKSLSGGERSYATVCFILALWDAMESPFRCLDEFDVFMDMVNRRISMDMMTSVADVQTERQFIFLTPQDMTHLPSDKGYRIFSMPDPDRGGDV